MSLQEREEQEKNNSQSFYTVRALIIHPFISIAGLQAGFRVK